jgi:DNA-binding response OmpR family regulator
MDHMMPLMDGIETTQKLRAQGYKGIIVGLTANALAGNDKMFKQNGFDDFISKPIDMRQLSACLNKYVRRTDNSEPKVREQETGSSGQQDNTDFSRKLLSVFCKDAGKAVVTLKETTANGDIKLFTTTAHAMKSALANIGENEMSELAFVLEKAGLDGDREFIAANTESFIEKLETLISNISQPEAVSEDTDNNIVEDTAYLAEQLEAVKQACEDYDRKAAFAALDLLKEKKWKAETSAALKEIREILSLHSDFDTAMELVQALLE